MYLPPIESNCNYEPFVSGDVTIADNAAIASGAIVQAAPNCRIVIASGVCIGMGAIIHAYNGTIEIGEGATVGAGVLIVGKAKIGTKACIGSLTTVINSDLEPQQTVAPCSILGDTSRQVSETSPPSTPSTPSNTAVGARYNTFIQPKPILIPQTPAPTESEEEAKTTTNAEVETGYNTFIQPKPISIPQTPAPTESEEEAKTTTNAEVETGYNRFIQPKPISIPQTPAPTESEEEAKTPTNAEVETGYNRFIQPKPISIPQTPAPTNIEEETATSMESEEKSQPSSAAIASNSSLGPKPISIPKVPANTNNGAIPSGPEAEATESEDEEQQVQTPKPQVAGLDYVQSMMKTLFPHKNISLSPEDEED